MAKYLVRRGFVYHSYSDILRDELTKLGRKINRDNLIRMGNNIRQEFGAGELSKRILAEAAKKGEEKVLAVGMRNPAEVEVMREKKGFHLWFVQAPAKLRYDRSQIRGRSEDKVSFAEFQKQEQEEHSKNSSEQQLGRVATMADVTIINDGDLESLYAQIDELLAKL